MRSRSRQLRNIVATYWQPAVFYGMLLIFFGMLSWFRLGTLVGGYSANELAALQSANGLRIIFDNPVNAPFTVVAYLIGLTNVGDHGIFALRATAALFGLLTLTTFYWLVRHWHGERSAILGTIIFGCSAWFLHTTRLGSPDILLFLLLALAASSVWLKRTNNSLILLVGFGIAAALLYIPGMIWVLIIGAAWHIKTIVRLFKRHLKLMCLGAAALLILITPLMLAIYKSPQIAKVIAGLPAEGWPRVSEVATRLIQIPYNLIVQGSFDAERWLGQLPILDAFSIVMLVFGVYLYARHRHLMRVKMVGAALAVGTILVSLGGAVNLSILMPFIYILIAAGIGFMLERWQKVFPRNVIAQSVSVGLISMAVIAASWYGLRHYYVAWPSAPATKQVFTIK